MQKDIYDYTKMQVKPKIAVRINPNFQITGKAPKKSKKCGKKSAGKMLIVELGKKVEKNELINNLAQAQASITFGHIARGDIDFFKNERQRVLPGKIDGDIVNFAGKDEVHAVFDIPTSSSPGRSVF